MPGYAWSRVFFTKGDIDGLERLAISTGLSIALVPLAIFFLNKLGVAITAMNSFVTIAALITLAVAVERVVMPIWSGRTSS